MYEKFEKNIAKLLLLVLILSMLPIIYLGRYNHPTGDDYHYGAETKQVWEDTGSLVATVGEAVKGVVKQYNVWQGTYSAMFLMYLPPNIFGEGAYRLVTGTILLLLTGSIFYMLKPIITEYLQGTKALWVIVASTLSALCVQTVPFQGESLFWYNGSMYYTGYYAVTLFFFGSMFRYLLNRKKRYLCIMFLGTIFLAGGNYVSLLPTILTVILITITLFAKHSKAAWSICCVAILLIICLVISAVAPGNAVRQSGMWKIPAWKAILKSVVQGIKYLLAWGRGWWIMGALIMTPFLWKTYDKISYSFCYPLVVCAIIYGIFCSMSCPTFYTMNSTGPARAAAIVYYGFFLATFICYYYILGYIYRWRERRQVGRVDSSKYIGFCKKVLLMAAMLLVVQIMLGAAENCTVTKAIKLLASGEAKAYEQEYQERLQVLEDTDVMDVVLQPYRHRPDMLYVGDMSGDATDVNNQKIAQYFHKNTVYVQY